MRHGGNDTKKHFPGYDRLGYSAESASAHTPPSQGWSQVGCKRLSHHSATLQSVSGFQSSRRCLHFRWSCGQLGASPSCWVFSDTCMSALRNRSWWQSSFFHSLQAVRPACPQPMGKAEMEKTEHTDRRCVISWVAKTFRKLPFSPYLSHALFATLYYLCSGFPGGSDVKNQPTMQELQEMQVQSLDWEDPLEEGMETHSTILAWRIPMVRGTWRATIHGVEKSHRVEKWKKQLSTHACTHSLCSPSLTKVSEAKSMLQCSMFLRIS